MKCTYANYLGTFDFAAVDNKIIVSRRPNSNGGGWEKYMPVVPDDEFIVKEQKTQLRAKDGAPGLYDFMVDAIRGGLFTAYVNKIIEVVGKRGKDARLMFSAS